MTEIILFLLSWLQGLNADDVMNVVAQKCNKGEKPSFNVAITKEESLPEDFSILNY